MLTFAFKKKKKDECEKSWVKIYLTSFLSTLPHLRFLKEFQNKSKTKKQPPHILSVLWYFHNVLK